MSLSEAASHESRLLCGEQPRTRTELTNDELTIRVSEYRRGSLPLGAANRFNRYASTRTRLSGEKIRYNTAHNRGFSIREVEQSEKEYYRSNGLRLA